LNLPPAAELEALEERATADAQFDEGFRGGMWQFVDRYFHTKIAGAKFPNDDGSNRAAYIRRCKPLELLVIQWDKGNRHDYYAEVVRRKTGEQLGFLPMDSSDLDKKSGAASKTLKGLEEQGGKTEGSISKLGKTSKETSSGVGELTGALAKFLAVIGGTAAIKVFVSDMIESSATLERFSKNLGLSASEVTQWNNATEEMDGKASGLKASLSLLSKAQTDLVVTGDSALLPFFSMMSVAVGRGQQRTRANRIPLASSALSNLLRPIYR
jgi:hypothetical protein